jgi:hypothetical protein
MIPFAVIALLPIVMAIVESIIRYYLDLDASAFINPSLISASISMVAPLMFASRNVAIIDGERIRYSHAIESYFSQFCAIVFFFMFLVWIFSVHASAENVRAGIDRLASVTADQDTAGDIFIRNDSQRGEMPGWISIFAKLTRNESVGYFLYYFSLILFSMKSGISFFKNKREVRGYA